MDIPLEISVELGRTRMLIQDLLKLGQGSVIELTKGSGETLEILANEDIDLVISDAFMPGLTGFELVEQIRKLDRQVPVIIASGDVKDGLREEAIGKGAFGFLTKPIHHEILMSMIRAVTGTTGMKRITTHELLQI